MTSRRCATAAAARRRAMGAAVLALLLGAVAPARALDCLDRYADEVRAASGAAADLDGTITRLRPVAEDGYAPAMYALADLLLYRGGEDDADAGAGWMRLAAARGYPPAYARLGDDSLAVADAAGARGETLAARVREREALFWYRLGEAHSEPDALWGLGEIYRRGSIVPASAETAFNYERSAVEQGVTSRLVAPPLAERYERLSSDYAMGNGTPADAVHALRWRLAHDALPGVTGQEAGLTITPEEEAQARDLAKAWQPPVHDYGVRAPYAFEPVPVSEAIVRRVQGALIAAGLEPGPVNGRFSDATARAVVDFEALEGTPAAAAVTQHLIDALRIQQTEVHEGSCSARWLDQQPAETVFADTFQHTHDEGHAEDGGEDAADALDGGEDVPQAGEDAGDDTADDASDDAGYEPAAPSEGEGEPGQVLDRVIRNNEAMLRHQMVNDAQREFAGLEGTAEGIVRPGAPALCPDVRGYIEALHAGAAATAATQGCFPAPAGTQLRVLWCLDADSYLCEFELLSAEPGQPRRGWGDLGMLE